MVEAIARVDEKKVISIQLDVWHALILHDIKSRFFGNGLGYLVTIIWPLVHIIVILLINLGRLSPHGPNMVLYAATAVVPYIACNYIGRFIMLGVIMNKSFLQYPIIKPMDLMVSRAFLELVSHYIVVAVLLAGLILADVDVRPNHIQDAVAAWSASVLLGVGMGILSGVVCMAWGMFQLVFILFIIVAWITCGVSIDPEVLPQNIGYIVSFNPVLHAVEWMREAYYPDYHPRLLSKTYLLCFSLACLGLGVVSERVFRGFLIQSR